MFLVNLGGEWCSCSQPAQFVRVQIVECHDPCFSKISNFLLQNSRTYLYPMNHIDQSHGNHYCHMIVFKYEVTCTDGKFDHFY